MTIQVKLLPCPFCGHELVEMQAFATRSSKTMGHPPDTGCLMQHTFITLSDREADHERIMAWNTRDGRLQ